MNNITAIKPIRLKLDRQKDGSYWIGVQIYGASVSIPVSAALIKKFSSEVFDFLLELTNETDEFVLITQDNFDAMQAAARPARSSGWHIGGF